MTVLHVNFRGGGGEFQRSCGETLFGFMHKLIDQLRYSGHERTAETYAAALSSVARFMEGLDVRLDEIDEMLMVRYEVHLRERGVTPNTSSFYMRILRAAYNKAVERQLIVQRHPFRLVYTGVDKTAKRAITLRQLRQVKELDLTDDCHLAFARDMFLFSFYTRGMSLIDMAYLTDHHLCNGRLTYTRHKTGQLLSIRWERCMQDIVDRYRSRGSRYLLPIIRSEGCSERQQYKSRATWLCNILKRVGTMAHLAFPLTMYVARHSWASIARASHIPLSVISEGMGHDSELTTQIYLSSYSHTELDRANRRILSMLDGGTGICPVSKKIRDTKRQ